MEQSSITINPRYIGYKLVENTANLIKAAEYLETLEDSDIYKGIIEIDDIYYILVDPIKGREWAQNLWFRDKRFLEVEIQCGKITKGVFVHGSTFYTCTVDRSEGLMQHFRFSLGTYLAVSTIDSRAFEEISLVMNTESGYYNKILLRFKRSEKTYTETYTLGNKASLDSGRISTYSMVADYFKRFPELIQLSLEFGLHKYIEDIKIVNSFKTLCMEILNITEGEFNSI